MKKLNIGCGNNYREGWTNLDINGDVKADIYLDVEKGLIGIEDNTFDVVVLRHVLEHIHPEKFRFVLKEINRVCKEGAMIKIWCPHFSCGITYRELDHYTTISYFTINESNLFRINKKKFNFFRESFEYKNHSKSLNSFLKLISPVISFFPNTFPLAYERFFCWIFPVEEVYFELTVKKGAYEK